MDTPVIPVQWTGITGVVLSTDLYSRYELERVKHGRKPSIIHKRRPQDFSSFLPPPVVRIDLTPLPSLPDVWRPHPEGKLYIFFNFLRTLDIYFHTVWMNEKFVKLEIINYSVYCIFILFGVMMLTVIEQLNT